MDYQKTLPATIAIGASASDAIDRNGFRTLALETVTGTCETAAVSYKLQGCGTSTGTFKDIYFQTQSGISGFAAVGNVIVALGNMSESIPRYVKVAVAANTATAAMECKIHASR